MRLRGIEFGNVFCSSGALGFFGDGYWYHTVGRPFGLNYDGATFVSKTTTLNARLGNMPLQKDQITPRQFLPDCIKVKLLDGVVLNSVGLSGPGAEWLFCSRKWQEREDPFFISFMSIEKTPIERMAELKAFVEIFEKYLHGFHAPVGLEINFSCPNVGIDPAELVEEVKESLITAAHLRIPLIPNFGPDIDVNSTLEISKHPFCDAISVANSLKYGKLPDHVNWKKLWGERSPLEHLGGGGLSGKPLFPIIHDWLKAALRLEIKKPLIMGGGILNKEDAYFLLRLGAKAVKLGTVGMLRPWRVQGIIKQAQLLAI
jgi:dihydroorotate dehydrogenase